ncbi:hypothetical protein BTM25_12270 [Actinomadura rubteroloni]|uniref:Uncharacterized protein n=1 Tax=Actinomadura rubteroloni TaxID=1926885 RepID=A0A2P4UP89_9ACTN|nr:type VII secretion target [Actinomadura rubteroloni]POM26819.1 hypothetical protein BTM25_12270 [Actinomadura rubteroloni]
MTGPGDELSVDPAKLTALGKDLGKARAVAAAQKGNASNGAYTDISGHTWGLVGIGFSSHYDELKGHIIEHLGLMEKFLEQAERNMNATAENYKNAEHNNISAIHRVGKKKG